MAERVTNGKELVLAIMEIIEDVDDKALAKAYAAVFNKEVSVIGDNEFLIADKD